jgi:hypothetical protein
MVKELLEKIPPERRWAITAKTLWRFLVLRGERLIAPELGTGKDIISPLWIKEKWYEINEKILGDAGRNMMPMVKEMFNIPVENAIDAAKLATVVVALIVGPEQEYWEIVEETTEKAVFRAPKCWCWEMYNEYEVDPEFRPCDVIEQAFWPEGYKEINPKITHTVTKTLPWGDHYCEMVIEFKEE